MGGGDEGRARGGLGGGGGGGERCWLPAPPPTMSPWPVPPECATVPPNPQEDQSPNDAPRPLGGTQNKLTFSSTTQL